jgi:hypothetical protein
MGHGLYFESKLYDFMRYLGYRYHRFLVFTNRIESWSTRKPENIHLHLLHVQDIFVSSRRVELKKVLHISIFDFWGSHVFSWSLSSSVRGRTAGNIAAV